MLLVDGARFILWTPEKEVDEFHPIIKEHIKDIFGEQSIFVEPSKLITETGKGSIPDGFVIMYDRKPEWYIVEIELSSHDVYNHVINQVGRFINGIGNTRKGIVDAIYHEVSRNQSLKAEFEEKIGHGEIYKYLNDLVSTPPILTIIIEKKTPGLEEAIGLLKHSPITIIEFQTFRRIGADTVHVHSFEPLNKYVPALSIITTLPPVPTSIPIVQVAISKNTQSSNTLMSLLVKPGDQAPTKLIDPNGVDHPVKVWKDVLTIVVEWLMQQGLLTIRDCPIKLPRASLYLVAANPHHPSGEKFDEPREVPPIWIETKATASQLVHDAQFLIQQFGKGHDFNVVW